MIVLHYLAAFSERAYLAAPFYVRVSRILPRWEEARGLRRCAARRAQGPDADDREQRRAPVPGRAARGAQLRVWRLTQPELKRLALVDCLLIRNPVKETARCGAQALNHATTRSVKDTRTYSHSELGKSLQTDSQSRA